VLKEGEYAPFTAKENPQRALRASSNIQSREFVAGMQENLSPLRTLRTAVEFAEERLDREVRKEDPPSALRTSSNTSVAGMQKTFNR